MTPIRLRETASLRRSSRTVIEGRSPASSATLKTPGSEPCRDPSTTAEGAWAACDRARCAETHSLAARSLRPCYAGPRQYVPVVAGLDYAYVEARGLYRQCIRHVLERARQRGIGRVLLGMGAALEKRRFGARTLNRVLYVEARDHYASDVIAQMSAGAAAR